MPRFLLLVASALLLSVSAQAQAAEWNIDKAHSHVGFTARHLAFAKVRGEFKNFDAKLTADAKTGRISALEATVDAGSVDTGIEKRDNHLRGDDFFAAKQHPQIKLALKSIKWKGNKFRATVALTIRGNTKDVVFEGELLGLRTVDFGQGPHPRVAYEASATINRKDFGLSFNGLAEGVAIVGDEVEITLEGEFSRSET